MATGAYCLVGIGVLGTIFVLGNRCFHGQYLGPIRHICAFILCSTYFVLADLATARGVAEIDAETRVFTMALRWLYYFFMVSMKLFLFQFI